MPQATARHARHSVTASMREMRRRAGTRRVRSTVSNVSHNTQAIRIRAPTKTSGFTRRVLAEPSSAGAESRADQNGMDRLARDLQDLAAVGAEVHRLDLDGAGEMVAGLEPDLILGEVRSVLQMHPGDS